VRSQLGRYCVREEGKRHGLALRGRDIGEREGHRGVEGEVKGLIFFSSERDLFSVTQREANGRR
jgi:hypothetical protein